MLSALIEVCEIEGGVHVVKGGVHVVKGGVHVFRPFFFTMKSEMLRILL